MIGLFENDVTSIGHFKEVLDVFGIIPNLRISYCILPLLLSLPFLLHHYNLIVRDV